jgi:hypothetical protein
VSGATLLAQFAAQGLHVALERGRLRYVATRGQPGDAQLTTLRARRLEILEALVELARERRLGDLGRSPQWWDADLREAYEERAAIMEFDGGLNRVEAELWAEMAVREWRAEVLGA